MEIIELNEKQKLNGILEYFKHHSDKQGPFWSLKGLSKSIDHDFTCKKWGEHKTDKEGRYTRCYTCELGFDEKVLDNIF
jgi:hypothetical protein